MAPGPDELGVKSSLGAVPLPEGGVRFVLWAPRAWRVHLWLEGRPEPIKLDPDPKGYVCCVVAEAGPGTRYAYALEEDDGRVGPRRPDPVSRCLPEGVHGVSEVVGLGHEWSDHSWQGRPLDSYVIYEIHVGTFTPDGTFDGALDRLPELVDLGVTAIELMPWTEVPGGEGARNWGYDGVQPFAVRRNYGGQDGLHRFVDACHRVGLAVLFDVVYNHLGPEGNYLGEFGPYFADWYQTPWGLPPNLDGRGSDEVRRYLLEHALECLEVHHADGLRLDSAPNIFDRSVRPFLEELSEATDRLSEVLDRPLYLFAETDDNDPRWVRSRSQGGLGLHGMWADDLHHAVHACLTGERGGFYQDFGSTEQVAQAYFEGAALDGAYARFRGRRWGRSLAEVAPERLVVFAQNHDLVGNRGDGARLGTLLEPRQHRLFLALTLLSPYLPLLFMGQEYGETRPFYFFTSFDDERVARATVRGRNEIFASFEGSARPPPPQDPVAKTKSCLAPEAATGPEQESARALHRAALAVRTRLRPYGRPRLSQLLNDERCFTGAWSDSWGLIVALGPGIVTVRAPMSGRRLFDSEESSGGESGSPESIEAGRDVEIEGPRLLVYGPHAHG